MIDSFTGRLISEEVKHCFVLVLSIIVGIILTTEIYSESPNLPKQRNRLTTTAYIIYIIAHSARAEIYFQISDAPTPQLICSEYIDRTVFVGRPIKSQILHTSAARV